MTRANTPADGDPVIPTPIVSWTDLTQSADPVHEASRARYRTIKRISPTAGARSSRGVTVKNIGPSGAQGSQTVHSVLSVLALQAERDGDAESVIHLVEAADDIEGQFKTRIATFLSTNTIDALPLAPFYEDIVGATTRALESVGRWSAHVFAAGFIAGLTESAAQLDVVGRDGARGLVEVQRALTDAWSLSVGDSLLVFQRVVGSAAMIEVLPGVDVRRPVAEEMTFEESQWPNRDPRELERLRSRMADPTVGRRVIRLTA